MTTSPQTGELEPLIQELSRLAERPSQSGRGMPVGVYISDKFHDAEQKKIFNQEWLCVGREDEIPETGDFLTFKISAQPIIVVRLSNASIHAMANVCRHRMMRLVDGRGNAERFSCPYHGWTYGIDGRLMGVRHMECTEGFEKERVFLPSVRCETWKGWIYVTLNREAEPISDRLNELLPIVEKYRMEDYVTIFSEDREWDTNWKLLCENFMEGYHLPVAHRSTVGKQFPVQETVFDSRGRFDGFTYQCFSKPDGIQVGLAHPENKTLRGKWRKMSVMPTVFPGHMYVLAPDHLWYLSIQPNGYSKVKIRYGAAMAPEVLASHPDKRLLIDEFKTLLDKVQEEDRHLVEAIFEGVRAPLSRPGPLSWLEREIQEFIQYLALRLSG